MLGPSICLMARRTLRDESVTRWNISAPLETQVIERDRACVYCGIDFTVPAICRGNKPSWEHIINDARIINSENIARCCTSCNASKGAKSLLLWLESSYCKKKGITPETVSVTVRNAITKARGVGSTDKER